MNKLLDYAIEKTIDDSDIDVQLTLRQAESAMELKRRFEDSRLLFYKPCCRAHKNNCPSLPCPDSKHSRFHQSDKRIRIIFGGNRSSKTTTCLAEILFTSCFKVHPIRKIPNPSNGRYRIYGSDFAIVEKVLIPKVKEWIPKKSLGVQGRTKGEAWENSYDKKYHILRLQNNNTLDFMSYDQDSSKSESDELDMVWGDEQMPEDIYSAVMARLVSRAGKFIMSVTPLYDISWAMQFLDNTDPQVEVFHFDIFDNPYNSDQAVEEFIKAMPEHEKEARIHGRFMELQGLVYKELRPDVHFLGKDQPQVGYPVIFALDPHPRKPTVMTWSYVTPKGDVVFFDELEMSGTARDLALAIRSKESRHPARTLLRLIDPAARAQGNNLAFETDTLREFEREGIKFTIADNSEAGYNIVHQYLKFNPSQPLGSMNRPQCYFTKDVPKTWFGMTHLMWDEWAFKKALKDDKERIKDYKKDFPDCVRYTLAWRPTFRKIMNSNPSPIGNMRNMMSYKNKQDVRLKVLGGIK